jgi:hypothetical protein
MALVPSVANKPFMLSVIMHNVIMLNVMIQHLVNTALD